MAAAIPVIDQSRDAARIHAVLRFAVGVTLAFVIAELMQWAPTFLTPVLVGVVLVNVPVRPPIKVALGLILAVTVSALVAVMLSAGLRGLPWMLFGITALIVFRALHVIALGRPLIAPLLLIICVTAIPIVGLQSQVAAKAFGFALFRAICVAVMIVWTMYLIWPRAMRPRGTAVPFSLPPGVAVRRALLGTAILTPLMLVYLMFGLTDALPVVIATAMIVATMSFQRGRMQALALALANLAGGIASLALFLLFAGHPSIYTLALVVFAASLLMGWRITVGDPVSAVVLVAFNAMLIVFGSSLLSDQGTFAVWLTRLSQFLVAGTFAVGMMTLLWPREE